MLPDMLDIRIMNLIASPFVVFCACDRFSFRISLSVVPLFHFVQGLVLSSNLPTSYNLYPSTRC